MKPAPSFPLKQERTGKLVGVTAPDGIRAVIITEDLMKRSLEAIACIRSKIGNLPHVKKLAYSPKGQLITLWTFVDNHASDTIRAIYKAEQEIMAHFSDMRFDFTVIFDTKSNAPGNFIVESCLQ